MKLDTLDGTPEDDLRKLAEGAERSANWFLLRAAVTPALLYLIALWRSYDPTIMLIVGIGIVAGLVGEEVLRAKAVLLRVEYLKVKAERERHEREFELMRLRNEIKGRTARESAADT